MISGANRGIGRSIAEKALNDGHCLSLGVREPESLTGTILDPEVSGKDRVLISKYDAEDSETVDSWTAATLNHFNEIDSLINCAGIFYKTSLIFSNKERNEIDQLWKVNVMGPWLLTKSCWKYLEANGKGRIIVLVSMSGKRSKGNLAGYSVSKFALMGLCQTMRNEGWKSGIRVTAICPSWVNTDMAKGIQSFPKEGMTQPKDIASITSTLLDLPNSCIPFEVQLNCTLET